MPAPELPTPATIQRTYLVLLLGNTLAASLIWGINTIFLLDAGLSNLEAFAANASFTAGMVLFQVPTVVVADRAGRRVSYLLGTLTPAGSMLLYVLLWRIRAPFRQSSGPSRCSVGLPTCGGTGRHMSWEQRSVRSRSRPSPCPDVRTRRRTSSLSRR